MNRSGWTIALLLLGCMPAHAGYSHHFRWLQKPDPAALRACIREMRQIVEARRSMLAGPDGEGAPEITVESLVVNGVGDDGHEPFVFPGYVEQTERAPHVPSGYNFCKTAGQPYDEVVTACLLVARDHFPAKVLAIASDGSWREGDWAKGVKLYTAVFGRVPQNPINGEVIPGEPPHDAADDVITISPQIVVAFGVGIAIIVGAAKKLLL